MAAYSSRGTSDPAAATAASWSHSLLEKEADSVAWDECLGQWLIRPSSKLLSKYGAGRLSNHRHRQTWPHWTDQDIVTRLVGFATVGPKQPFSPMRFYFNGFGPDANFGLTVAYLPATDGRSRNPSTCWRSHHQRLLRCMVSGIRRE